MLIQRLIISGFIGFSATCYCVPITHNVHEERIQSETWIKQHRLPPRDVLDVRIGLTQQNLDKGYDYLLDVSHPSSPNYGKHWSHEKIMETFSPSKETTEAVRNWVMSSGIKSERIKLSHNRGWLAFNASTSELESLVYAKYHYYEHSETKHVSIACDQYHVPVNIQHHIDDSPHFVTPGVKLSAPLRRPRRIKNRAPVALETKKGPVFNSDSLKNCYKVTTPACVRALYGVPLPDYKKSHPNNSFGMYELRDTYSQRDLNLFFKALAPQIPNGTHPRLESVDGAKAPASGVLRTEPNLDYMVAYPLLYPQELTLYQVDDKHVAEYEYTHFYHSGLFNTWLDALDGSYCTYKAFGEKGDDPKIDGHYPDRRPKGYNHPEMCGVYKPAKVISVSWTTQEFDWPYYYQARQCNEYMKLGLQGVSIFFSSGDNGVAGTVPFGKKHENHCLGKHSDKFNPGAPLTCPYVTVVGATQIPRGNGVHDSRAVSFSGGGFSNLFERPKYQNEAVATWFKNYPPKFKSYTKFGYKNISTRAGVFNRRGRAMPDVSAVGVNIPIYDTGHQTLAFGTSASSPIFASIVSRIVEERLKQGKGSVGFINPVLYENPHILNDVRHGDQQGCNNNHFSAGKGWDPVTGLGTPNYQRMLKLFTSLP